MTVPPSGGSLEIGNPSICSIQRFRYSGSPFGGIPRNWKLDGGIIKPKEVNVPPSGGSLEIGNARSTLSLDRKSR